MDTTQKNTKNPGSKDSGVDQRKLDIPDNGDLRDKPRDKAELAPETGVIDLPDVKDIPGQEFIHPAPLGEMADTTIASDDEEGIGLFDDDKDDSDSYRETDTASNVSREEKYDLQEADENMPTKDDQSIRDAAMDNEDDDGQPLNEKGFGEDVSGSDLDVPGTDADDADEEIGEEDEENNTYSASDENNDNVYGDTSE